MYAAGLFFLLFRLQGRQMVVTDPSMLDSFNYWNSVNLVPFRTIRLFITNFDHGVFRGNALMNLVGNVLVFVPAGLFVPVMWRRLGRLWTYVLVMSALIVAIEVGQLMTRTGSLDVDDFLLNMAGALVGFAIFARTPLRRLHPSPAPPP
jgi:glycopeptide antibiotics resistance protein